MTVAVAFWHAGYDSCICMRVHAKRCLELYADYGATEKAGHQLYKNKSQIDGGDRTSRTKSAGEIW